MAIPRASAKGSFLPFPPPPSSPRHPAGRTAGSARTRSRVQTLEDPFWGTSARFPVSPSPKCRRRTAPCSWAVRRVCALSLNRERNEASRPPLVGRACVTNATTALAVGTRVNPGPKALSSGTAGPQAASPYSWTCRRLSPPSPHSGTKRRTPAPCSWAGVRRPRAEGTGRRHCRLLEDLRYDAGSDRAAAFAG